MNIPAWFSAWWQTLTGVEAAMLAVVAVLMAWIACLFIEAKRLEEAEHAALDRELDRLVEQAVDAADRAAIRASSIRPADVAPERRPIWSQSVGRWS